MMMKGLEAGGLDAAYRQSREKMREHFADKHYDPNIGGLYELEQQDYINPEFPRQFDGKLIKGLNFCVPRMNVMKNGIRVVFMRRDAEEIRQSFDAFFDRSLQATNKMLNRRMERIVEQINNRRDVKSCNVLWYRDVVEDPGPYFTELHNDGWPIDVDAAKNTVDPNYCRYKIEKLIPGISDFSITGGSEKWA
ncbi:MAG: hypothetical protein ACYS17_14635 [Planctomycetota bacterium]|jgi:hypothetical protein